MKLLLDTHVFLWINNDIDRLSQTIKEFCNSGAHDFYLSIASAWEIQIKTQLGKLSLAMPIEELVNRNIQENSIGLLSINLSHISCLEQLPLHHKDPFDRIIIAQAIIEGMAIVSADHVFSNYTVRTIW
ncbi:PINc domain-containing protein [Gammaproteobacteria bacterium]